MKKSFLIAGAVLGCSGLGAALISWPVSGDVLRSTVSAQLASAGYEVTRAHGGLFTLLPIPRIEMRTVEISGQDGKVTVSADAVRGSLRLFPLLNGRVELADLTLVKPTIEAPAALVGRLAPTLVGLASGESGGPVTRSPLLLDMHRIVILDGSLKSRSTNGEVTSPLTAVNCVLSGTGAGAGMSLTASLNWHSEHVDLSASGLGPELGEGGAPTPLSIKVTSALLTASLDGRTTGGLNTQTDGDLTLRTPDASRLAAWLGSELPLPIPGAVEASGALRIQPGSLTLSGASLKVPSGRYDGVLTMRYGGARLSVDGTLATDLLDLAPALSRVSPMHAADGSWSREPFVGEALPRGDLDLRISAARLTAGRLAVDNAALSILSRNGRLDTNLSNAEAYKGSLKARLAVSPGPRGLEAKLTGSYDKLDSGALSMALLSTRRISGLASGSFALEGGGESPFALMRSLEGRMGFWVRQGEIAGINLPDVLKRIERRPLNALDVKGGRTVIESGGLNARFSRGVAELSDAAFVAPGLKISLNGQIGLADRQFNLAGLALTAEPVPGQDQVGLPFDIIGSFDEPQVVPDAKSLIRRSSAAAPFFEPRKPPATISGDPPAARDPPGP